MSFMFVENHWIVRILNLLIKKNNKLVKTYELDEFIENGIEEQMFVYANKLLNENPKTEDLQYMNNAIKYIFSIQNALASINYFEAKNYKELIENRINDNDIFTDL